MPGPSVMSAVTVQEDDVHDKAVKGQRRCRERVPSRWQLWGTASIKLRSWWWSLGEVEQMGHD